MPYQVRMNWIAIQPGYKVPVYYDHNGKLVDELHLYGVYIARLKKRGRGSQQRYDSAIEATSFALKALLEFLATIDKSWRDVGDDELEAFWDWEYTRIRNKSFAKQEEKTAMRSVNIKLRHVYQFYKWAQQDAGYLKGHIGRKDCKIQSILPFEDEHLTRAGKRSPHGHHLSDDKLRYPICFAQAGEGSRWRLQYTATDKDKQKLIDYWAQPQKPTFTAKRNILLMDMIEQVGFREASLASLTTDQFTWEKIEEAIDAGNSCILVTPASQKFGKDDSFAVPVALAARVAKFIEEDRANVLKEHGWSEEQAQDRIWINLADGHPHDGKGIYRIFSREEFESAGIKVPLGLDAGPHCLRRKFLQDEVKKEIAARQELGLSTSAIDIKASVMRKAGHDDPDSLDPYLQRVIEDSISTSPMAKAQETIRELLSEIGELKTYIARLERLCGRSG